MDNLEKMKNLIKEIDKHNYNYYVLDNPTISDKEYDKLYYSLVDIEKETGIILPYSPTQRVGDAVLEGFNKKKHEVPLYSLNKVRDFQDLENWTNDMLALSPNTLFTVEYKFDGLQIVIEYNDGVFVSAVTRGNGSEGEDVSLQMKTVKTVPLQIPYKKRLIVQGECMMTNKSFEKYNKTALVKLKNPRNGAAGAIRNLDLKETAKRNLDYFCYSILLCEDKEFSSQEQMHNFLKENGFQTGEYFVICKNIDKIVKCINDIDSKKRNLDVMIDGMVIKINDTKNREKIGFTARFPRWAMAYKFEPQEETTLLKDVVWQVGRSGRVTPIAVLEPCVLAGATITRATLNNIDDIHKKEILLPSRVFIRRSNEVIPEIMGLAEKFENSKEIVEPKFCPCCGCELIKKGAILQCPNSDGCSEQIVDRLTHFASREGFNIDGLSEKTALALYQNFGLSKPSQLFSLKHEDFLKLDKFKEKKAKNLENSIKNCKKVEFYKFLFALGIGEVGVKTAKDLAKKFESLEELSSASALLLASISDIGEVVANNIVDFFNNEKNREEIGALLLQNIEIVYPSKNKNGVFDSKTFVLTGTLSMPRADVEKMIEDAGGKTSSSVSKNTDFVLVGENAGSKLEKAKTLGIKILNEKEFLALLNNQN